MMTLIFIDQSQSIEDYNELLIQDDAHFYLNAGAYFEPARQYLDYSGMIIIPFAYVLHTYRMLSKYCPGNDQITQSYSYLSEHLNEVVDYHRIESRPKRSLLPIVSDLSGGLCLWNTIEIQESY